MNYTDRQEEAQLEIAALTAEQEESNVDEIQLEQQMEAEAFQQGYDEAKAQRELETGDCEVCGTEVSDHRESGRTYYCPDHVGVGLGIDNDPAQAHREEDMRYAHVVQAEELVTFATVERYLPENYIAMQEGENITIQGHDVAGWTLDGYVIPRLATWNIIVEEEL